MEKLLEEVIVSKELIVEELPVLPQKEIQVKKQKNQKP
jgi:hypothetical protein